MGTYVRRVDVDRYTPRVGKMQGVGDKKKLHGFLGDLLRVGLVKGFRYFATHLRGREELICSVINEPSVPILLSATNSPASSFALQGSGDQLPKDPGKILMSQKRQRRLSGYGFINVGLPPASPAGSENGDDDGSTLFLIAGYARYSCPYVWVRSNHERLVRLSSEDSAEKDYPLLLKSTSNWKEADAKVWDVIAELVQICTSPSPPNPFSIDMDYFEALPVRERTLATAAMVSLLRSILASGTHRYDRRVREDLKKVSQLHFRSILEVLGSCDWSCDGSLEQQQAQMELAQSQQALAMPGQPTTMSQLYTSPTPYQPWSTS